MSGLPYVTAPGNVDKALKAIKSAATPSSVSQDFVKTILGIPGGSGNQITAYLRKIGLVESDGSPSSLYRQFRNSSTEGSAAASALKVGYGPLYTRNEYMHRLSDEQLRGLIIEETGVGDDSSVVTYTLSCIKHLKKYAKWDPVVVDPPEVERIVVAPAEQERLPLSGKPPESPRLGLNLGYTINLNLPATTDVAVFNAIFSSLKEHLLRGTDG